LVTIFAGCQGHLARKSALVLIQVIKYRSCDHFGVIIPIWLVLPKLWQCPRKTV